jgi:hypothetical protein
MSTFEFKGEERRIKATSVHFFAFGEPNTPGFGIGMYLEGRLSVCENRAAFIDPVKDPTIEVKYFFKPSLLKCFSNFL